MGHSPILLLLRDVYLDHFDFFHLFHVHFSPRALFLFFHESVGAFEGGGDSGGSSSDGDAWVLGRLVACRCSGILTFILIPIVPLGGRTRHSLPTSVTQFPILTTRTSHLNILACFLFALFQELLI